MIAGPTGGLLREFLSRLRPGEFPSRFGPGKWYFQVFWLQQLEQKGAKI